MTQLAVLSSPPAMDRKRCAAPPVLDIASISPALLPKRRKVSSCPPAPRPSLYNPFSPLESTKDDDDLFLPSLPDSNVMAMTFLPRLRRRVIVDNDNADKVTPPLTVRVEIGQEEEASIALQYSKDTTSFFAVPPASTTARRNLNKPPSAKSKRRLSWNARSA
jgi:hypothetical protein